MCNPIITKITEKCPPLTDQIAKYVSNNQANSNRLFGAAASGPITLNSSASSDSLSLFNIQKVITEKISLQRRVDDYKDKLNQVLQAAEDTDKETELNKELEDHRSQLQIIKQDRDGLQSEVTHLKQQLNAYSEIVSGKEGESFEAALSFRDQTLDYKSKWNKAEDEMSHLKMNFEEEKKDLRLQNDDLRNELVNCKVQIESAGSMAQINDDRVELAEREVNRMRREISQQFVKIEKYRNESDLAKKNYSEIKDENRSIKERLQMYEHNNVQQEGQIQIMEMNLENLQNQLAEKQSMLVSNGAIWNKINEMDDKNNISRTLEVTNLQQKIKDLEFSRDTRLRSQQDFIKESEDMLADLRYQLKNKDSDIAELKKEFQVKEKELREKYEKDLEDYKLKNVAFRREMANIDGKEGIDGANEFYLDTSTPLEDQIATLLIQRTKEKKILIRLKTDIERLTKTNTEIQSISKMSEDRYASQSKDMELLKATISEQSNKNKKEIEDLLARNEKLNQDNYDMKLDKEKWSEDIESKMAVLNNKNSDLQLNLNQANDNLSKKDELLNQYRKDLQVLKDDSEAYIAREENYKNQFNLTQNDNNQLTDKNFALESEIKMLKRNEKALETTIKKAEKELEEERLDFKTKIEDIEATKLIVKEQNDQMHVKMKLCIQNEAEMEKKLKAAGISEPTSGAAPTEEDTSMADTSAASLNMSAGEIDRKIEGVSSTSSLELIKIIEQIRREKQRIEVRLENTVAAERRKTIELDHVKDPPIFGVKR